MIVVFAGAGASNAVGGYPTTKDFMDLLPASVADDKLFRHVADFIERDFSAGLDIELILAALDALSQEGANLAQSRSLLGYLLGGNRVAGYLNAGLDFQPFVGYCNTLSQRALAMRDVINQLVFRAYSSVPKRSQLAQNWEHLMTELRRLGHPLELFTTNYDPVLEVVIDECKLSIDTGRRREGYDFLSLDVWRKATSRLRADNPRVEKVLGMLTKLHGSLDWTRRDDRVEFSSPRFSNDHSMHAILYPGYKGVPTDEPFVTLHQHLEASLAAASGVIFIGYAFRDAYINDLIERHMNPRCSVAIIDPKPATWNFPRWPTRLVEPVPLPFGREAVGETMKAMARHNSALLSPGQ